MYRAWYRKWRPLDFDTVLGQEHVTDILKYQVKEKKVSHAYLFCGSRGTGKTSCAKILARAVNCENPKDGNPCNCCYSCKSILQGVSTDVIEIDAASNNGVENVRDIKEDVNFTPAELAYRVYIIDEVHMMSASAFNALLKTLEEPPSHVIFILATTELQKLPNTIVSRCQRYDFRRLPSGVLVDHICEIAKEEGVSVTEDGALVIARTAQGGMRDAISLLELCAGANQTVNDTMAASMLGCGNRSDQFRLISAIRNKDHNAMFSIMDEVFASSRDVNVFWQELIGTYRDLGVLKTCRDAKSYLDLTDDEYRTMTELLEDFNLPTILYHGKLLEESLFSMQRSAGTRRAIAELTLLRMCEPRMSASVDAQNARLSKLEETVGLLKIGIVPQDGQAPVAPAAPVAEEKSQASAETQEQPVKKETKTVADTPAPASATKLEYWGDLVEQLVENRGSLRGFMQTSSCERLANGSFVIHVQTPFAVNMVSRPEVLSSIKNLISSREGVNLTGASVEVKAENGTSKISYFDEIERALNN